MPPEAAEEDAAGRPAGPLSGVRVLEFAGIGPAPFCGMLLADMGADVLRVDRLEPVELGLASRAGFDVLGRGKRSIRLDLKNSVHLGLALGLIGRADILIEGFRPGVMERLGLAPAACLAANPRLVYGRVTGWGREGPLARRAGHDINYLALSGALHALGRPETPPAPPLALLGDFSAGAMFLAFGLVCALLEARRSGHGQVVDSAIVDGLAMLMASTHARHAAGVWIDKRGSNALDGGAPWYDCYATRDGGFVAIGPLEQRFYDELVARLGLDPSSLPDRNQRASWPRLRAIFAETFASRTREEWCRIFEGSDACFAPVLSLAEAPSHAQHQARGTFATRHGFCQPSPAPRLSRTPGRPGRPAPEPGQGGKAALEDWGLDDAAIAAFAAAGAACAG